MVTAHRTTFEEFMALPDDGNRHELVRGEIVVMPPPKPGHGRCEVALAGAIDRYLFERATSFGWHDHDGREARDRLVGTPASGEVGVKLRLEDDREQVRGLDVAYFSPEQVGRLHEILETEYAPEMPALAAEIITSFESAEYIDEKVTDYLAGGARLIWLVYPRTRSVKVMTPDRVARTVTSGETLEGGDVLPGFQLPVASLFA